MSIEVCRVIADVIKICMFTSLDHILIMPLKCGHQEAVQDRATKLLVGNRVSYKERLNKTSLM